MRSNFASYGGLFALSLDKQYFLARLNGNCSWQYDLRSGRLNFGSQYCWHAQPFGTESQAGGTWLWAWANAASNIPDHLLHASLALKAYGVQHGIPELTQPELSLDQIDGHTLALLASGICDADAYYRCPYDGGALYVLIMDDNFPECPDPPLQRVATIFPQAIASLAIPDHEEALCGYLDDYGLDHEHTDNQIIVRNEGGEPVLTATFDDQKRLMGLEVKLEAGANSPDFAPPPDDDQALKAPDVDHGAKYMSGVGWDEAQRRRMMGF